MCVLSGPGVFLPRNSPQHRFQRVAVQNLGYSRRHHLTCRQERKVEGEALVPARGPAALSSGGGGPAGAQQLAGCDGCSERTGRQKPSPRSAKTHRWPPEQLRYGILQPTENMADPCGPSALSYR